MLLKYVIATNAQKILSYILSHPHQPFHERDIARKAGVSYGSANGVLNLLQKDGILLKKGAGRMCYYSVDLSNAYVKELKILNNLLILEPMAEKLIRYAFKIAVFGSWAAGSDTENSDIDVFILTSKEKIVKDVVEKYSNTIGKKIQAVIKTPEEMLNLNSRDKVLMKQIGLGKVLFEREIENDNF